MSESVLSLQRQSLLAIHSGDAEPRRSERKVRARLRALECVKGVLEGKTYQQVADEQGYSSRGNVHRLVNQTLARHEVEGIEELRALELARLDHLQSAFYEDAVNGDLAAAGVCLKIIAQRCRLLQLDKALPSPQPTTNTIIVGGTKAEFISALRQGQERNRSGSSSRSLPVPP